MRVRGQSSRRRRPVSPGRGVPPGRPVSGCRRIRPGLLGAVGLAAALAGTAACERRAPSSTDPRSESTIRMAERLRELGAVFDTSSLYSASARLEELRSTPTPGSPLNRAVHEGRIGLALLAAGRPVEAVERLEAARERLEVGGGGAPLPLRAEVQGLLGTAWLHLAIRENCLEGIGTPACLAPVPPEGIHAEPRGARGAVAELGRLLALDPGSLGARWLLNLAHMMLGDHPEGVPERFRIPTAAFEPEHPLPRFPDIAPALGVDVLSHAGGAIAEDLDGDGRIDLVASSWHLGDPLRYFRNRGDGTFEDVTRAAGLEGITGGLNLIHADYDADGHPDILVLRGGWLPEGQPNSLLRNRGDGTFEDVTEAAGLLEPSLPTQTAAWGDFDADGDLDLYVGNESWGEARHPSQLFLNRGDGSFADVAAGAGAAVVGVVKAVVAGDYDGDGRLDLYVSRRGEANVLLRNLGPGPDGVPRFEDVSAEAGVEEPIDSFPAWFWDYDNDGRLDLFVSGFRATGSDIAADLLGVPHEAELPRLYRNEGDGTFSDRTGEAGLDRVLFAMGANHGDLDNDGWEDFYVGTGDMDVRALVPNRTFRNDRGVRFQEVTAAGGFGHIQKGHGVAFADLDADGDQDIYAEIGAAFEGDLARNVLFENPGNGNGWVTLRLEGVESNRSAIGARVRVVVETPEGPREIHRAVGTGGSFGSSSLQQEIGLGKANAIREIEVRWPATGRTDVYRDVAPRRVYRLREGTAELEPLAAERIRLGGSR